MKKLVRPRKQYAFVGRQSWKRFVVKRTTTNWLINSSKLKAGKEPDLAALWKKARIPKDTRIGDEIAKINDKIDSLFGGKRESEFKHSGSDDVLIAALESPEHTGRVQGVGGFVTPTTFFNLPNERKILITKAELLARDRQWSEELEKTMQDLMAEIAQLKAIISAASNLPSPILSDKANFHPDECSTVDQPAPPEILKATRSCELAVDMIDNKVAVGMVFPNKDGMSSKIHGRTMLTECVGVSVDGSIKPDVLIPVPITGEMEKVDHQVVGSHVACPVDLSIYPTPVIKEREVLQENNGELQRMLTLFNQAEPTENVPKRYGLLFKLATTYMKVPWSSIHILCDDEVFGVMKTVFLLHENLIALLQYEMVGQDIISTYMMYLHTMIRKNAESEIFAFCNPGATYKLNSDFELYVVKRLKEGGINRIFFLPYNHNMHWILTIIWNGDIYILNPRPHPIHFPPLEKALLRAVKSCNAEIGRGNKVPTVQNLVGSPKQSGGHECGYIVMRYMKDIIEDKDLSFSKKWMSESRKSYTKEELDEVQFEALDYVQEHM